MFLNLKVILCKYCWNESLQFYLYIKLATKIKEYLMPTQSEQLAEFGKKSPAFFPFSYLPAESRHKSERYFFILQKKLLIWNANFSYLAIFDIMAICITRVFPGTKMHTTRGEYNRCTFAILLEFFAHDRDHIHFCHITIFEKLPSQTGKMFARIKRIPRLLQ